MAQPFESLTADDPVLYFGLDIATKRDTCALVGVYQNYDTETVQLWGHKIWEPPVNLVTDVEPMLHYILTKQRVASLLFDPFQAYAITQRLETEGYGSKLVDVNQMSQMPQAANLLHEMLTEERLHLYDHPEVKSHFSWANAKQTERGWRIVKMKQTRPIDFVVALAMALMGCINETGHAIHKSLSSDRHMRPMQVIP